MIGYNFTPVFNQNRSNNCVKNLCNLLLTKCMKQDIYEYLICLGLHQLVLFFYVNDTRIPGAINVRYSLFKKTIDDFENICFTAYVRVKKHVYGSIDEKL